LAYSYGFSSCFFGASYGFSSCFFGASGYLALGSSEVLVFVPLDFFSTLTSLAYGAEVEAEDFLFATFLIVLEPF
jgi:hypothetical protein